MTLVPDQPLDAIVVGEPPGRRRIWWALGCGALLLLASFGAGLAWFVAWFTGLIGVGQPDRVLTGSWQSPQEERAAMRAAFDGTPRELDDPDLGQLRRLLDRVAATGGDDPQAFGELVDFDGLLARVLSYPGVRRFTWLDRRELMKYLRRDIDGPGNALEFRVVSLVRVNADEVIVYAYASNEYVQADPFRFLICRGQDDWQLVDWERAETGWSEAEQFARAQIAADDYRFPQYEQAWNVLFLADEQIEAFELDAAREHLERASRFVLPPKIADLFYYMLASRWYQIDAWDRCLQVCDRVQDPDGIPGFYNLQANALHARGETAAALAAAERYEHVLGFQPDMMRLKADLLDALQRPEQARACRKRLAGFAPDNVDDVFAWCQALPEDQRGQVLELVRATDGPVELAAQLARRAIYSGDHATREMLQRFVEETAADSPTAFELEGRVLDYQGEYRAAAESYRQAAERTGDPPRQGEYWFEFLGSMVEAGEPVAGYSEMPDRQKAFQTLIEGFEYGEAMIGPRDLPGLIEAHGQDFPEDPRLHFAAGCLAVQGNELELADREFAAAEDAGDPQLAELAASERRSVLRRQGRLREAYVAYADDEDAFRQLAGGCRQEEDAQGLRILLSLHRSRHPDDPWLPFFTAVLRRMEDQPQEALESLPVAPDDEPWGLGYQVRWLRQQLLIESGQWQAAYETSDQPREAFRSIASALQEREDAASLRQLQRLHRAREPDDPELRMQAVEWAIQQGQDAEVASLLTPWPRDLQVADYRRAALRRELIGSLLRLDRISEARERGLEFADAEDDSLPLLMVLVHERDWQELESRLDDPQIAAAIQGDSGFQGDAFFEAYRTDPAARPLRERVPPPLPPTPGELRLVLFLDEPPALSAERLRSLAGTEAAVRLRELPSASSADTSAFELPRPEQTLLIAFGPDAYQDDWQAWEWAGAGAALRQAVERCRGWIEILLVQNREAGDPEPGRRWARRLAAELGDGRTAALAFWRSGAFARVILADGGMAERLRDPPPLAEAFPEATELFLAPRDAGGLPDQQAWTSERRRELRAFCRAAATDARARPYRVQLLACYGSASETLPVRVRSCEHTGYGNFVLQGELEADSRLWPYLKRGEPLRFHASQIVDWKAPPEGGR